MSEFDSLMQGMSLVLSAHHLGLMVIGVLLGILVGVLPGLGAPNGVALLLPLTFSMSPVSAIILLSCMYWGALFGGSITSILFNIPGEPSSVATTFDGYPMARNGQAGEALTAAFTSALLGALVGVLLLTFLSTHIARFALAFSSPEFFAVYLLAFCTFIGMSRNPPLKTLVAMTIGFAMAAVGMDTVSGDLRLTFDQPWLLSGLSFEVAVIGLFGIGEILCTVEEGLVFRGERARITPMVILRTWARLPRYWLTWLRSALVGCWMGVTPGGPTAASFMSYSLARRFSKNRENFGKGEVEGVIAPETADHSAGTSALLPMLTLGIPGSATAAVMLGGLMIWGLHPGPTLFVEQHDFVWGLIASMYLGNVVSLIVVLATVPLFASILRIPFAIVAPIIVMVCAIGAYSVHNAMLDVVLMLLFGALGYLFKKLGYPIAPLVLAAVLGDKAEDAFRQSMLFSDGQLSVFWSNPLVASLTGAALAMLLWPLLARCAGALFRRGRRSLRQRLPRGMRATPFGETLIYYSRMIFAELSGMREELVALESGNLGRVTVGAIPALASSLLTRTIATLKQSHPRLSMSIQVDTSDVLVQALQQDQLDVVLGRIPSGARTDDLVFDSLGEEELCVVVGAQNPLSQARKLDWGELQELTWVLQQHPSPMRGIVNQAFHNARIDLPSSIVETTSIMTLLSLLQQTDMIGITPRSVIEDYPGKHLLAILPIQLEPRLPPYGLITRRNRVHSSAMQTFMASVHAEQARHLAK
ncbi:hypothetical protein A5N81_11780 [Pseudomonas aeruginosa]|nr:hypothetical protein A5N81_11780 [Pseudomonas aeruginosa]